MNRTDILKELRDRVDGGHSLVAASAGTGLIAAAAEQGGADLVVVYNTSYFRSHGQPSLAGMMPFADANGIVLELAPRILPKLQRTPAIAGVCASDPFRPMPALLRQLRDLGFAGVQNFPTIGLIDGNFRDDLEATGISIEQEYEMIATARDLGLLTCAFVCDAESAAHMAQAGADIVAPHLGVTRAGGDMADAVARIQEMRDAAVAVAPETLVLFHGGPTDELDGIRTILASTRGVAGYFGASTIERLPVERSVRAAVSELCTIPSGLDSRSADPLEPIEMLDTTSLPDYLRRNGLVDGDHDVTVTNLGGGISNALMRFDDGTTSGVLKQSRPKIQVEQDWFCDVRRNLAERDAIQVAASRLPAGSVPAVRFSDDDNYAFVMDAAPESARLWKADLLAGAVDVDIVKCAAEMLAQFHTSTAGDTSLRRRFGTDMLWDLRIEPYYMSTMRHHPELRPYFEWAVRDLVSSRRALVHGDFVPKNMLVTSDKSLILLDYEISHFGEPAYDVATFINHLLLKAHALPDCGPAFFSAIQTFVDVYRERAQSICARDDQVLRQLGCLMLARIDGKSPVEYITDEPTKTAVRSAAYTILTDSSSLDAALQRVGAAALRLESTA